MKGNFPANVWIGASVEDQQRADERIPELIKIPAAVRFLSAEPLLGPLDIEEHLEDQLDGGYVLGSTPIHWVIFGGESGPGARLCDVEWIARGIEQCQAAGVKAFVKQLGSYPIDTMTYAGSKKRIGLTDKKGGDWSEWAVDLKVRQWPQQTASQRTDAGLVSGPAEKDEQ